MLQFSYWCSKLSSTNQMLCRNQFYYHFIQMDLFVCRHLKQMITEMCDSQTQHVTSTRAGVRWIYLSNLIESRATFDQLKQSNFRKIVSTNDFHIVGINLIAEIPPKECTERVVCCDGGDPHLGHPKVYINLVMCHPKKNTPLWN